MDRFPEFINRLLSHEGGFTKDPKDPGNWTGGVCGVGELKGTKFGIAANTFPQIDIEALTRPQAMELYRAHFWDAAQCGLMPPMIGFQLLDGAVNSGIHQATRWVQRAAGVADDGKFGPVSLSAVLVADKNDLGFRFLSYRLDYMTRLKNWSDAGKGWARRIALNMLYAANDN